MYLGNNPDNVLEFIFSAEAKLVNINEARGTKRRRDVTRTRIPNAFPILSPAVAHVPQRIPPNGCHALTQGRVREYEEGSKKRRVSEGA